MATAIHRFQVESFNRLIEHDRRARLRRDLNHEPFFAAQASPYSSPKAAYHSVFVHSP
jgi:hypothetical protein